MKFDKTISLVFAAELKPPTPANIIYFAIPFPGEGKSFFSFVILRFSKVRIKGIKLSLVPKKFV
jgi:hypothetical protein